MLDNLRNFATTWPGKILGMFLLVGLAGFGITGVLTSIGSNTVANVGDREITIRDFQTAYQTQINVAAGQLGTVPTPDQAISLGIPSQVLNQLATDAALNILSDEFSLGVSDERLAEGLRSVSSFSGTLGNFDREVFERVLQQNGITENEYFATRRDAAKRAQIAQAIFSQAKSPDVINAIVQRFNADLRTLDYFVVSELSLLPIGDPGDEVLQTYLEENQNTYRTQELRSVRAIQLSPEILAKGIEVSEADIAAEYERTKLSLFSVESRAISQVFLNDDAQAADFDAALATGSSFAQVADAMNLEITELGDLTRGSISDAGLADAAFAMELNAAVVIPSVLGQRVISVTNITPANQMSLADASDGLAVRLANAGGRAQFVDVLDQIEEQRAAFIDLDKTAAEFGLTLVEVALNGRGDELAAVMGLDPAEAGRVANGVFGASIGGLAAMIPLGANKSVWYDLLSVDDARAQILSEVRDDISSTWISEQRAIALQDKAEAFVTQLETGQSVADIAVINSLFPVISQPMTRSGDGSADIDGRIANAAFNGGLGHISTAQNTNGDYVVFKVASVTASQDALDAADVEFIENGYRDNVFSDFATALRDDAQLSINQGVLNQILSYGTTGAVPSGGGRN